MLDVLLCICSRGLTYTRALEAMEDDLEQSGAHWDRIWEHQKAFPDAQNAIFRRALAIPTQHVWMVEEDICPPRGCLDELLLAGAPLASARYRLAGGAWNYTLATDGRLMHAGLGCVLAEPDVLRRIGDPWLRADRQWHFDPRGIVELVGTQPMDPAPADADFWARCWLMQIPAALVQSECRHLYVHRPGKPRCNDGVHDIRAR